LVLGHPELEAAKLLGKRLLVLTRDHRRDSLLGGRGLLGLLRRRRLLLWSGDRGVRDAQCKTQHGKPECKAEPAHTSSDVREAQKIHHMKNEKRVLLEASACRRVSSLFPSSSRPPAPL